MKRVEMSEYDAVVYYLIQAVRFERMADQARKTGHFDGVRVHESAARTYRKKAEDLLGDHFHIRQYQMWQSGGSEFMAGNGWNALANHIAEVFVHAQLREGCSNDEAYARLITCGVHKPQTGVQ